MRAAGNFCALPCPILGQGFVSCPGAAPKLREKNPDPCPTFPTNQAPPTRHHDAPHRRAGSSRGNLRTTFTSAEAGKTAYYALRQVSTPGDKGLWSEPPPATMAAETK